MKTMTLFDLDETLVHGDTSVIWREYLMDKGFITDANFIERDNAFQKQYAEGTLNLEQYIAFSLSPIADTSVEKIESMLTDCIHSRVMPIIFSEAKVLIKKLLADNDQELLVISATATFIVSVVAKELGINNAIGVDLAEKNNCLTATIIGVPSFREGKVTRLKEWLAAHKKTNNYYQKIVFYTDSINDLPLCEFADEVHTVNPCSQLRPIAQARNWEILPWGNQ